MNRRVLCTIQELWEQAIYDYNKKLILLSVIQLCSGRNSMALSLWIL